MEKIILNLESEKVYYIKSKDEFISDYIIDENSLKLNEVIIVNALSNNNEVILLPKYRDKNKRKLKKLGIDFKVEVGNPEFLQFTVDKLIENCRFLFFGLNGLHFEAVTFLEDYLQSVAKKENKTCFLIDYNSEYLNTSIKIKG